MYEASAARSYEGAGQASQSRPSYSVEIQRKLECALKGMSDLEDRLSPVLAPNQPEVMRENKLESCHNAISEIDNQMGILNDKIARMLRRLEI